MALSDTMAECLEGIAHYTEDGGYASLEPHVRVVRVVCEALMHVCASGPSNAPYVTNLARVLATVNVDALEAELGRLKLNAAGPSGTA